MKIVSGFFSKAFQTVLQEKETTEALKGLLYFPIEGKHKIKDFALLYRGPAGRLDLEFKP